MIGAKTRTTYDSRPRAWGTCGPLSFDELLDNFIWNMKLMWLENIESYLEQKRKAWNLSRPLAALALWVTAADDGSVITGLLAIKNAWNFILLSIEDRQTIKCPEANTDVFTKKMLKSNHFNSPSLSEADSSFNWDSLIAGERRLVEVLMKATLETSDQY